MNIYINVANLEKLNKEENKSGLINELLDKHYRHKSTFPAVQLRDEKVYMDEKDTPEEVDRLFEEGQITRNKAREEFLSTFKPCKHGADPKLCKFAKKGKSCK